MKLRWLVSVVVLGACKAAPFHTVDDALRRSEIRVVAVEDRFSLYSPYDLGVSRDLAQVVERNLFAVCGTLGVWLDRPIHVHAYPVERLGVEGAIPVTSHDVAGFSNEYEEGRPPRIVFFVSLEDVRNASSVDDWTTAFQFNHGGILRHELGHLVSSARIPDAPTWIQEGLALEFEYSQPVDGRLVPENRPQTMGLARRAHGSIPLAAVLDWHEDAEAVAAGDAMVFQEGRPLAHSYMRFLLERRGGDRSMESFRAIFEMDREEHLALEDEWHAWLDAGSGTPAE